MGPGQPPHQQQPPHTSSFESHSPHVLLPSSLSCSAAPSERQHPPRPRSETASSSPLRFSPRLLHQRGNDPRESATAIRSRVLPPSSFSFSISESATPVTAIRPRPSFTFPAPFFCSTPIAYSATSFAYSAIRFLSSITSSAVLQQYTSFSRCSQLFGKMESTEQASQQRSFTIKLWPPSRNTRAALVERMAKNLSTESIFSRKYGLLSKEEAAVDAKQIEEAGFAVADDHYQKQPDGDGSSAVQVYAKETSKLMLEVLKRGPKPKENGDISTLANVPETVFDISGGRRAFIDAEEAHELLRPLAEEGNTFTKICFSNRSFGLDAARVAEPILLSLRNQLMQVDLSDFVAGRPENEALEVMRIFSSALEGSVLTYLNLSNNALGEKGVRAFESLLKSQSNLEELYLMNDGISPEAAIAVQELIPSTEKLKILHFHNNMTGEGALAISEILKCSPSLEDFRCSSTRVDFKEGIKLVEGLETCRRLSKLDLTDNMFGVDVGIALSKLFEKFTDLTEVNLSFLNLEDEGAIAIFNALKESAPLLTVLEIAGNEITVEAVPVLAGCIAAKQSLKKLNLSENELMDDGAVAIAQVLQEGHENLKELDMSTNSIRRVGARCLAHAVVSNKLDFVSLNLNGNAISDEGIDEVKEILKSGKNSVSVLGPLDDNDAEGEANEGEEEAEDEDGADIGKDELESKLQHLKVDE